MRARWLRLRAQHGCGGTCAFDQHSLDVAARGQDAAVSMLGVSFAAARRPTNVFSQGTRNLIAALKAAGVRRLIVKSSFGVGDSRRDAGLLERVSGFSVCGATWASAIFSGKLSILLPRYIIFLPKARKSIAGSNYGGNRPVTN